MLVGQRGIEKRLSTLDLHDTTFPLGDVDK
jgi:hypothetical protein